MPKYRIVQVRPEGLPSAFIIEELIKVPESRTINEKYRYMQTYIDNISALNAASRPKDYYIIHPAHEEWRQEKSTKDIKGMINLTKAEEHLKSLREYSKLLEQDKAFKRVVIQEYD